MREFGGACANHHQSSRPGGIQAELFLAQAPWEDVPPHGSWPGLGPPPTARDRGRPHLGGRRRALGQEHEQVCGYTVALDDALPLHTSDLGVQHHCVSPERPPLANCALHSKPPLALGPPLGKQRKGLLSLQIPSFLNWFWDCVFIHLTNIHEPCARCWGAMMDQPVSQQRAQSNHISRRPGRKPRELREQTTRATATSSDGEPGQGPPGATFKLKS